MTPALRLGPLVFPIELALLAAAIAIGLIAGRLLAGARAEAASRELWRCLLLGLLAARLAFVWQYRDHFAQDPIKILDLRDGGWTGAAGLAAALAYGLGSAPGFGKIKSAAERGELPLAEALDQTMVLLRATVDALSPERRNAIRELSSGRYNLRKALRRSLEHLWEHLAELSRRPDGPALDVLGAAPIEGGHIAAAASYRVSK